MKNPKLTSAYLEWRVCQFCKVNTIVYRDGETRLFKYGIRHYAHAVCLARRFGVTLALEKVPQFKHTEFKAQVAAVDDWDRAAIEMKDRRPA